MSNLPTQPVLALLGHPVAGNPTQYMLEKAFEHHELDWEFLSLDVTAEELGDAVRGMRSMGFLGGNCIDPHKHAIAQYLQGLTPHAEMIGAVNCILREDRQLIGENTEGKAVVDALRRRLDVVGLRVVILGAGRLARAVAVELTAAKAAEITIVNRTEEHARHLADLLYSRLGMQSTAAPWIDDFAIPPETQVVIHATSIGMGDEQARVPLQADSLAAGMLVVDAIANPPRTSLVREAEKRGLQVIDGLEVFIAQTAVNFRLWTGVDPDLSVLRESVEEYLEL